MTPTPAAQHPTPPTTPSRLTRVRYLPQPAFGVDGYRQLRRLDMAATKAKAKAKKQPAKKTKKAKKPGKVPATKPVAFVPGKDPLIPGGLKGELRDVPLKEILEPATVDRIAGPEDAEEIAETANSLAEVGQLQPVLLEETPKGLVRVFGRRRIAAAKLLGWKTVRAVVCGVLSPAARRVVVAVENVQRKNLTPIEESLGVAELLVLQALEAARQLGVRIDVNGGFGQGGSAVHGQVVTAETIAELEAKPTARKAWAHDVMLDPRVRARACEIVAAQLAKPVSWVRDRMYLSRLDEESRELIRLGKLPLLHAREIARVGDPEHRANLARAYAAGGTDSISDIEPGQLADLREEVSKSVFRLVVVPWRTDVAIASYRPCDGCPHNSASQPGLFEGGGSASDEMVGGRGRYVKTLTETDQSRGVCTYPPCYQAKLRLSKAALADAAKKVVDEKGDMPERAKSICSPSALRKKISERKEWVRPGPLPKVAEKSEAMIARQKLEAERNQARTLLQAANRDRIAKHERAFARKLSATPGLWAAYAILRRTKAYEATQHWDKVKVAKAIKSPQLLQAVNLLAGDPLEAILELEKLCGRDVGIFNKDYDSESGFMDLVASALGIDVGTPPTLEDYMPSARKAKAEAEKKSKADADERSEEPAAEDEQESENATGDEGEDEPEHFEGGV